MSLPFNAMDILDNTQGNSILSGPVRILGWGRFQEKDLIWLINLPRKSKTRGTRRKGYMPGPYSIPLPDLLSLLSEARVYVLKLQPDLKLRMADKDRLEACGTTTQRNRLQKDLRNRDVRYEAIKPLVGLSDATVSMPLAQILTDQALGNRIAARKQELDLSSSTLYNWLHRYWAGGCQKNALLSNYERCGNPGQPKAQRKKLGRNTRLFRQGLVPSRGYPLSEQDKARLASGYRLISHSMRPKDAYLATCAAHWAEHAMSDSFQVRAVLYPKYLRPTFNQFTRWGKKLNEKTVMQMLLGPNKWRQASVSKGGSEQDGVGAVGQQAMFDGTSTDVYLTSYRSRLTKLPPMTRLILKESRTGLIYGLYCGWEAPSPQTALLAILHGAMPCKAAWAARYGVAIPDGAIPGLLARTHLADNGELKAAKATEAEEQFGFGIEYTPTMSGDRKGGIETQHHSDHAHVDHRLPGSTHGKQRARGESHAALGALWNNYEYMAEYIRYIVRHNTEQEVPDLAPDDMLLAVPPIKPTRVNIYQWLTDRHMNVSLPVDFEALRAFTLSDVDAVIRKNGIYLEAKVHGRKTLLPRLRYVSAELAATGLLSQVKQTGSPIHIRMKMDRTDLSQAWIPTKSGMVRVTTSARDKTILTKLTLDEWILYLEEETTRKDLNKGAGEQADADVVLRHMETTATATREANAELGALEKRPSKEMLRGNLDANRKEELRLLQEQEDILCKAHPPLTAQPPESPSETEEQTAADSVMDAYHAQLETA